MTLTVMMELMIISIFIEKIFKMGKLSNLVPDLQNCFPQN